MPQLLDLMETLVDSRLGILEKVWEVPKDEGAPDFVYMTAKTCNLDPGNSSPQEQFFIGTGVAVDRPQATAKAMGEAIERYCAVNCTGDDFPVSAYDSADFPCVQPEEFVLFSATQYSQRDFTYAPFAPETRVHWIAGIDLITRDTIFVPAQMVFLSPIPFQGHTLITQQISTGLGCHTDPTLAALKAICEVIERDAISVTWLARIPHSTILLDSLSVRNRELISRLEHPGVSVTLCYLKMDHGIPVIFSIMHSEVPDAPSIVVAAGSDVDPETAVRRSLEELGQIWCFAQTVKLRRPKSLTVKRWANVRDMESHAIFYFSRANTHLLDFLLTSRRTIAFSEITSLTGGTPRESLDILLKNIGAVNHRAILVDITSDDLRDLGVWVFRALIPGFHPLFMGHHLRALGLRRLNQVCERLRLPRPRTEKDLNPAPHPFS